MAVENVGVYRKWLEPVPKTDGKPIPKSQWPKKRRHQWIVGWYGTNNKRYRIVFGTRKEAERHAVELQGRVRLGRADKPRRITFADFVSEHEEVMRGQVACRTLAEHIRALRLFEKFIGGSIRLSKIEPRHAEAFIAQRLASGLSVATVNKDIRTLRRIFNLAIEPRGYVHERLNPFAKLKQRKKAEKPIRYVTTGEYRRLMDSTEGLWWRTLISVAYGSGLRRGEILNLTWTDIDFENHCISIKAKGATEDTVEWEPKDHENRVVPICGETEELLATMEFKAPEGHPYVFLSAKRLRLIREHQKTANWKPSSEPVNNLIRDFDKIWRGAGMKKCTIHDLRRSAITNWAHRLPIHVVQQLAGHSNITTTRKYYLAVRSEDFTLAARMLDSVLSQAQDN